MKRMKKKSLALIASMLVALGCAAGGATTTHVHAQSSKKAQSQVTYACPMHPEVKSKKRGKCPKCEMALVPVSTSTASQNVGDARGSGSSEVALRVPDTNVVDQNGRQLRFYTDLVKGKTVAINFVFTTCKGVCPTLSAKFRQIQRELGERVGRDIELISISVDPTTDVPERLKEYAGKFNAAPGWTFVTGSKPEIDELLRALGAFAPDKGNHPQTILIGNEATGYWTRTFGLSSTKEIAQIVTDAASKGTDTGNAPVMSTASATNVKMAADASKVSENANAAKEENASHSDSSSTYFPNVTLLTQENKPVHFYNDLLKGKIVLVNFMFTTCKGVCSPMTANLAKVQRFLGERVGRDINMISISVDPEVDTTDVLKKYAANFKAQPGWYFLTGEKKNVDWVLYKLGGYVENKGEHSAVLIIGNEVTGDWMKLPAMANPQEIADAVIKLTESKNK